MRGHARLAVAAAILLSSAGITFGATRTWTGAAGGGDPSWTTPANWTPNGIPATGEDLVLNAGALATSNNNFGSVLTFNTISVKSHVVVGAAIALNAGLTAEGAQISLGSIKLNNAQTFTAPTAGVAAAITCTVDTNGKTLSFDGPGQLAFLNVISGAGGVTKSGSGIVQFNAANSYTGITTVNDGTLLVFGSQPASSISIDDGVLGGSGTVGAVSFVDNGGNSTRVVAPGSTQNGTGILTVSGDFTFPQQSNFDNSLYIDLQGTTPGTNHDQLKVNGAVNLGGGNRMFVFVGSGFTPAPGSTFLIIDNDGTDPIQDDFFDKPEGALFTAGGTEFVISYRGGDGNDVTLHVPTTRTWDGGGADDKWTTAANWVGDVAPQAGDSLAFPANAAKKTNTNNLPAGTMFNSITFSGGGYFLQGNETSLTGGITDSSTTQPNGIALSGITLEADQMFTKNFAFFSSLNVNAPIKTNGHRLTLQGSGLQSNFAIISGTGGITNAGSAATLGGGGPNPKINTYTGTTIVSAGELSIFASQPNSPVSVIGGSLTGPGPIGPLNVTGGQVHPPQQMVVAGNVNLGPGSTLASDVGWSGSRLVENRLDVAGSVQLNNGTLLVSPMSNGRAIAVGDFFNIVNNDGTDAVQGTFASLPEGAQFTVQDITLFITYKGGDGNDVVLQVTAVPPPAPTPTPPAKLANISTRLRVQDGDNVLIGGMIATGSANKKVMIRAIGPTLTDFGLAGALPDPTLELFEGNVLVAVNDDWTFSSQQAEIVSSGLAPGKDAESAIIATLTAGNNYTAIVRGKNGQTGVGVVEAFDLDQAAASKLANISTRGFVDVDDNVMIAGLIVAPENAPSLKILVRALGPTLGDFGVPGVLLDPTLDLVNSSGTVIRSNDNWQSAQQAAIEAANLAPNHLEEAALIETLNPGAYTAIVRGSGRTTGVGLVEVYNIQ